MGGIRFGWLGDSRRAALAQLIKAELTAWSRDWWVHHAAEEILVDHLDREPSPQARAHVATAPSGALAMYLGGKDLDAFGKHLSGAVESADSGWAQRIGEEALVALAERLFRSAGISHASKLCESSGKPEFDERRFGALHLSVALGRLVWTLSVDRQLADRLVPPKETGATSLTSRATALDQANVGVRAILEFGFVDLTDLSDLRAGEILVGERRLQDTLHLHIEGQAAVASGYLKRSGTHRAVVLDGFSMQGNNP